MKYGKTNTFRGRQANRKGQNSRAARPSLARYFSEMRWLKNKSRNIAKAQLKDKEDKCTE